MHAAIHREIAREQHKARLADAERRPIAKASKHADGAPARARSWWERARVLLFDSRITSRIPQMPEADRRSEQMSGGADHFGHRESDGIVVDLYWKGEGDGQFRVEVVDKREGARFVLRPATGREAIQAYYHPFAMRDSGSMNKARAANRLTG